MKLLCNDCIVKKRYKIILNNRSLSITALVQNCPSLYRIDARIHSTPLSFIPEFPAFLLQTLVSRDPLEIKRVPFGLAHYSVTIQCFLKNNNNDTSFSILFVFCLFSFY